MRNRGYWGYWVTPDKKKHTIIFNPLANAEQWIKCLMWYQEEIWFHKGDTITYGQKLELLTSAIESREALLIAILETLDEPL